MFGQYYQEQEVIPKAKPGVYAVRLSSVREVVVKDYNVLRFEYVYEDGVKRTPNRIDIFDVVNPNDKEALKAFNYKMSKIRKCFNLSGSFNELSYNEWVGHSGKIEIKTDPDGWLEVYPVIE